MEVWILILAGLGMAYLGLLLWESDVRLRFLGFIPIPKLLIAGLLIFSGVGAAISGFKMIPDNFLGNTVGKVASVFDFGSDRKKNSGNQSEQNQYEYVENAPSYVSGHWGDKFVRSNGYTYPFVFDDPITQCVGFTLEYEIVDVAEGNLSGNFRYEVYVRQTNGKWKSVKLFQMDGYKTSMYIDLEKMMDIDAVAVVCQKKGDASFSYTIAVCDARYT